tara:strand:+ start:14219 stop:14377 length:159 start_codon:yes stop_codon:yes gene_type:complete
VLIPARIIGLDKSSSTEFSPIPVSSILAENHFINEKTAIILFPLEKNNFVKK